MALKKDGQDMKVHGYTLAELNRTMKVVERKADQSSPRGAAPGTRTYIERTNGGDTPTGPCEPSKT